jgi:hypothetical protein
MDLEGHVLTLLAVFFALPPTAPGKAPGAFSAYPWLLVEPLGLRASAALLAFPGVA